MILSLRRRHRIMWLLIAILLPVGFVTAIMNLPETPALEAELGIYEKEESNGKVLKMGVNDHFKAEVVADAYAPFIRLEVLQPIDRPISSIHLGKTSDSDIDNAVLLGTLGPKGTDEFVLDSLTLAWPTHHLIFYDRIKQEVFETLSLE